MCYLQCMYIFQIVPGSFVTVIYFYMFFADLIPVFPKTLSISRRYPIYFIGFFLFYSLFLMSLYVFFSSYPSKIRFHGLFHTKNLTVNFQVHHSNSISDYLEFPTKISETRSQVVRKTEILERLLESLYT